MFREHTTEEIMNFIFGDEVKEEMEIPRKKEESKKNIQTEDNTVEISIELKNYDEVIRKLENIKKLLNEISNIHIEVK